MQPNTTITDESPSICATIWGWAKNLGKDDATLGRALAGIGVFPQRGDTVTAKEIYTALVGDKDAAMTRKLNAEAEDRERENKVKAGLYISVEEAAKLYGDKIQALMERMDSMGAMLDSRLASETSPFKCRLILNEHIEETKKLMREVE